MFRYPGWVLGEFLARRRGELGLSQGEVAERLAVLAGQPTVGREDVSRWERDKRRPTWWLPYLAEALEVSVGELRSVSEGARRRARRAQYIDAASEEVLGLLTSAPQHGSRSSWPPRVGDIEQVLAHSYQLDDASGGGAARQVVERGLAAAAGLFDTATGTANTRLHAAVAELTQMAGWLAIDADRHSEANRYLTAALFAAYEIDDDLLASHVLGYMSVHALYRDRISDAAALARTAIDRVPSAEPSVGAILHARLARAHAREGREVESRRAMDHALNLFDRADVGGARPSWIRYVDTVELAAQNGACLLDLGCLEAPAAIEYAIQQLELTAPERRRDLVHYRARLGWAYLAQGEAEHAAEIAGKTVDLNASVDSDRVSTKVISLIKQLEVIDSPAVQRVLEKITSRPS